MSSVLGKLFGNPTVRTAILVTLSNTLSLYSKAFINVLTEKLEELGDEPEEESTKIQMK